MKPIAARTVEDALELLTGRVRRRRLLREHAAKDHAGIELLGGAWVPFEGGHAYYQPLDLLLRYVAPADLPPDEPELGAGEPRGLRNRRSALSVLDLRQSEERLLPGHTRYAYQAVTWEQLCADFPASVSAAGAKTEVTAQPRFALLGPPGIGKSAFEIALTFALGRKAIRIAGQDRELVPVFVKLREWAETNLELIPYLAAHRGLLDGAVSAEELEGLLRRGDAWLLFDGWDEISRDSPFHARLRRALTEWRQCPLVLSCRTLSYRNPGIELPAFVLQGFKPGQRNAFINAYAVDHGWPEGRGKQLRRILERSAPLARLAASPLLLNLICIVAQSLGPREQLAATRPELYHRALEELLPKPVRDRDTGAPVDPYAVEVETKSEILAHAALLLFLQSDRELDFTGNQLKDALTAGAHEAGYGRDAGARANRIYGELVAKRLVLEGSSKMAMLHPNLHEWLCAKGIARLVNSHGWADAQLAVGGKTVTISDFIDEKCWDVGYREVITMLVGCLDDPQPLIDHLADPAKDAITRNRLTLAACSFAEIDGKTLGHFRQVLERIARHVIEAWDGYVHREQDGLARELLPAFPALAQAMPNVVFPVLLDRLSDRNKWVRRYAVTAFRRIGTAAARDEVTVALRRELDGKAWQAREAAADALGSIGSSRGGVWNALEERMDEDESREVCRAAGRALASIRRSRPPTSKRKEDFLDSAVLRMFCRRLSHRRMEVREAALEGLGVIGATAESRIVLNDLLECLADEWKNVRELAIDALGSMGAAAARDDVLTAILQQLTDSDRKVCSAAFNALRKMGAAAARDDILAALVAQIAGEHSYEASLALGSMGAAAARDDVLTGLLQHLQHRNPSAREQAADTLGMFGASALRADVRAALTRCLGDENIKVRAAGIEALGKMGVTDPQLEVSIELLQRLADEWFAPWERIGYLGTLSGRNDIVAVLIQEELVKNLEEIGLMGLMATDLGSAGDPVIDLLAKRVAADDKLRALLAKRLNNNTAIVQSNVSEIIRIFSKQGVFIAADGRLMVPLQVEREPG